MKIRTLLLGTALAIATLPALAIPAKSIQPIDDSYQLSDGRRAHFVRDGDTLRMRLGTSYRERLLQDDGSGRRFVSRDGQVSVVFTADASGRADQVTLSMPAAMR